MKEKGFGVDLGAGLFRDAMIFGRDHQEEVAPAMLDEVVLNLPYQFTGIQENQFDIIVAIHAEGMTATEIVFDDIQRELWIEGPDVDTFSIYLSIGNKETTGSRRFCFPDHKPSRQALRMVGL